ncbi:TniQ family protein [Paraburkholderia caribensis]|uniref:TniQ family protein n=1 Tax=Paraburkholderia caribensis TaxID=75105 RepID=UPI001D08820E
MLWLGPEGESGQNFESLTSYLRRLSALHGISPGTFACHVVGPLLREHATISRVQEREFLTMNGTSKRAEACVNAIERLTMRNDLVSRTMLPLRTCVAFLKLLSKHERFCPSCYRDDESLDRPKYNRLLWAIQYVEACPLHNALLETVPKVHKHEAYSIWLPGVSRIDGTSLSKQKTRKANEWQIRSAHLVVDLLDDMHRCPKNFRVLIELSSLYDMLQTRCSMAM